MSWIKSREVALYLISAIVAYMFIEYLFKLPKDFVIITENLQNLGVIVTAFAGVLAVLNILIFHIRKIQRQSSGWLYSVCLLAMFIIVLSIGVTLGPRVSIYMWIQQNVYTPTSAAVWAIMAFYYVAACYHVFRVRNTDALILFVSALIVVLNNSPAVAAAWPGFKILATWLQDVPGTSGIRGCYITVGIGLVALAIRIMLRKEKGFFVGPEV